MMAHYVNPAEIKSVSSASKNDEEETSHLSDSSAETKKIQPVLRLPSKPSSNPLPPRVIPSHHSSSDKAAGLVIQAEESIDVAPSPAPVPIRGGEDEVIRVSQVRKIKVNLMESPKKKLEIPQEEAKIRSGSTKNTMLEDRMSNNRRRRSGIEEQRHDDDSSASDCEPMDVIEKSPYETTANAEKGVEMFTRLKAILKERNDGDDYRTANEEATKIFGPTYAWSLVKTNALIDKSGMVYSQEWQNGNIRGNQVGKIPKNLLLLCLVSKRFGKAQDLLLSGLTRDLEVSNVVQEAIHEWKIAGNFEKVLKTPKNFQFSTMRRDAYKCAIFVARVFSCYKALGMRGKIDPALKAKVLTCLKIMEAHLPDPVSSGKKRKKSIEPVSPPLPSASSVSPTSSLATASQKRKRGRPKKHPLASPRGIYEELNDEDDMITDEDMVPYNPPASRGRQRKSQNESSGNDQRSGSKGTSRRAASDKIMTSAPISRLISRFEEQYHAMGEIHRKMGNTLDELKVAMQENRTATEEEIRTELLLEFQDSLLKTFGKK